MAQQVEMFPLSHTTLDPSAVPLPGLSAPEPHTPPALTISKAAVDLIITEEVSDPAYYRRHYQHFDWPGGASGPTVGNGYDCGYCEHDEIQRDWVGIIPQGMIDVMKLAAGHTGQSGAAFVIRYRCAVTIPWDAAYRQFSEREVPKWIARVVEVLPNCDKLSPDSFGALVSLAYNRGPSFHLAGTRYAEMRAIAAHMEAGEFEKISNEIKAMKRLWPVGSGVWKRRDHEAALFTKGLLDKKD